MTQPVFVESPLGTRLGSRSCRHSIQVRGAQVSRELTFWERGTMQAQRRDRCLEEKNKWGRGLEHECMGREGCCVCARLVRNCLCDKMGFKWRPGTREVPKGIVMLWCDSQTHFIETLPGVSSWLFLLTWLHPRLIWKEFLLCFRLAMWTLCLFRGHQTVSPGPLGVVSPWGSFRCLGIWSPRPTPVHRQAPHHHWSLSTHLSPPSRPQAEPRGGVPVVFPEMSIVAFISGENLSQPNLRESLR